MLEKRVLSHRLCRPTGCELQESLEQSCRNIQKHIQVLKHSILQDLHIIFVQLCVSLFCHVTILVMYNWILLTVHEILQRSLDTSCHISGLELSSCYGLFAERSRPIQRHDRHVEQVINSCHTTSITIALKSTITIFIRFGSCSGFGRSSFKSIVAIISMPN